MFHLQWPHNQGHHVMVSDENGAELPDGCPVHLFGDQCHARCVESFYDASQNTTLNATNRSSIYASSIIYAKDRPVVLYTCSAPDEQLGQQTGQWHLGNTSRRNLFPNLEPVPNLNCTASTVSAAKSNLSSTRCVKPQKAYPGEHLSIRALEGFKLQNDKGPTIEWVVKAYDEYGFPRNYLNLNTFTWLGSEPGKPGRPNSKTAPDLVLVDIQRVPLNLLDAEEAKLQPRVGTISHGVWPTASSLRSYQGRLTNVNNRPDVEQDVKFSSNGQDGSWTITHQFTEHGIFSISIYLCKHDDDDTTCMVPANLLPRTGVDLTFTICPQNSGTTAYSRGCQVCHRRMGLTLIWWC